MARYAHFDTLVSVKAVLDAKLTPQGDGTFAYTPGWSDKVVAEKIGCKQATVAHFRKITFGPLYYRAKHKPTGQDATTEWLSALDRELLDVKAALRLVVDELRDARSLDPTSLEAIDALLKDQ